jgi:hypothetical protein
LLSIEEFLASIKKNAKARFDNDDNYNDAQQLPFFYAVIKEASLEELVTAGMRDAKESNNQVYKSSDAAFKSIMVNLISETGRDSIHSAQLARLKGEWDKARTAPKVARTSGSAGAGHFSRSQPATGNTDFNNLFDELILGVGKKP